MVDLGHEEPTSYPAGRPMPAGGSDRAFAWRPGDAVVSRFAPSPTGLLHLGHALSARSGFDLALRLGGRFLLRIEDTDPDRCRPELAREIEEHLAWLGLTWETPVLRQSEHFPVYAAAAERLAALGLLYPCFATRGEIEAAAAPGAVDPDGAPLYRGPHRHLEPAEVERRRAAGDLLAMRIDMGRAVAMAVAKAGQTALSYTALDDRLQPRRVAVNPMRWGDAVIQRKSTPTSYHLSVVVDDARQGVTIVTRGVDLQASTEIHRLLQILLDLPEPAYQHHALILDADGRKLSKRDQSTSLKALREQGVAPDEVWRRLGLAPCGALM